MRLIQLSANHASFKTVNFNKTGLTIIVGSKSSSGETYNGVGKSLLIEILHFCLGSNKKDVFEASIPQWEFTLKFDIDGVPHEVSRNTSKQSVFFLNHVEVSQTEFNKWMQERVFNIPNDIKKLTFRSLLPKFMRQGNKHYVDPRDTSDQSDYDRLIRNAFLLGIDTHLIAKKCDLRDEIVRIKALRSNFKNDTLLKDFYSGGKDSEIYLSHLEETIKRLERDKNNFVVAEDYYQLQTKADDLAKQINEDKNKIFMYRNAINNINESIKEQPDLPIERVKLLYKELENTFKPDSLKRLQDVSEFHKKLLENRIARLSKEKLALAQHQQNIESLLKPKQKELDKTLGLLGEARALDQYTSIVNQIADFKSQADRLRDYKKIEREYSDQEAGLAKQLSDEVIKTNVYLDETKDLRDKHNNLFKTFVSAFYPSKLAGISVHNNDGDNKLRFNLDVHVENDSSDGINEVRIFCYDFTLLTLREGHSIRFIFHDSRLYANMDVRQRATLFRTAHEVTKNLGLQYIATLNPDTISGMEGELSPEELQSIVYDNVVLELKDDSDEGKLLGIQVDMHYEG